MSTILYPTFFQKQKIIFKIKLMELVITKLNFQNINQNVL